MDPQLQFPQTATSVISVQSPVFLSLKYAWDKVDTLWAGTDAMRTAGVRMLPKEIYETDAEYLARLNRTTLVNYYKDTIQDAAGRVFSKDVRLLSAQSLINDNNTNTPAQPEFQLFAVDVDGAGNNITQFSKNVFEQAINHGISYILVDYPRTVSPVTLEQEVESGARPIWIHVPANKTLDYKAEMVDGKHVCTLFRYEELIHELSDDGFSSVTYQQIRVYRHATGTNPSFAVYRRQIAAVSGATTGLTTEAAGHWDRVAVGALTDARGNPLPSIPVAVVYTNKLGFGIGAPALESLADLNIAHWQAYSDYMNICHLTNVPFLFGKGIKSEMDENGKKIPFILSPGRAFTSDIETAEISWVEHSGSSIASAKEAIDDLVKQMKETGLKLSMEVAKQGRSATEAALNSTEANSRLKSFAVSLTDALNLALFYTAQFLGIEDMTRAKVSTDFADTIINNSDLQYLVESYKEKAIDAETLIYELQRRGTLDGSVDVKPPKVETVAAPVAPVVEDTAEDEPINT